MKKPKSPNFKTVYISNELADICHKVGVDYHDVTFVGITPDVLTIETRASMMNGAMSESYHTFLVTKLPSEADYK